MRHVLIAIPLLLAATYMIAQNPGLLQTTTDSANVKTTVDTTSLRPVMYHMYSRSGRPLQYELPKQMLAVDTAKGKKKKAKKAAVTDIADK